ncbi:MAG TPA: hypothetical protein VHE54_20110 [Puia sp.]|nr:hypothetical protein [Puia sp.]
MRTLLTFCTFFCFTAAFTGAQAQTTSLKNSVWKFYVQPLNDTLTMHFDADTNWSTSSSGEMIVRSLWKESGDTLRFNDVDGTYPCHDGEGVYRYVIDGDTMSWVLLSDPCADRAGVLSTMKFIRKK